MKMGDDRYPLAAKPCSHALKSINAEPTRHGAPRYSDGDAECIHELYTINL